MSAGLPGGLLGPVEYALAYVARGWAVMPLHEVVEGRCSCGQGPTCGKPGKHPRTRRGVDDATTDPALVGQWWARWPSANVGVACGPSGLLVVDLDGPDAVQAWRRLCERHGQGATLASRTARGWHLLYRQPVERLGNSAGRLAVGIDTRGVGGYVVAPPSVHATGHVYAWHDPAGGVEDCPGWLAEALRPPAPPPRPVRPDAPWGAARGAGTLTGAPTGVRGRQYLLAAVQGELQRVMDAQPGTRNATLCRAAFALGQLVASHGLDEHATADALRAAGLAVGLDARETEATIRSGLTAGARKPRTA